MDDRAAEDSGVQQRTAVGVGLGDFQIQIWGNFPSPAGDAVGRGIGAQDRQKIIVVGHIHLNGVGDLFLISDALSLMSFSSCLVQGGQKHSCKNCDDRNDHKKFHKREKTLALHDPVLLFSAVFGVSGVNYTTK